MPNIGGTEVATVAELALELGVHKTTINRIAKRYDIGKLVGIQRVFTRQEAASIRKKCHLKPGNPDFGRKSPKK